MNKKFIWAIIIAAVILAFAVFGVEGLEKVDNANENNTMPTTSNLFQLVQTIPLSNVSGRIDHMDIDLAGQRLFVAEIENNSVDIIDLKSGQRIHTITGLNEPQGVIFVPKSKWLFVSNGGDGTVRIFDSDTLHLVKTIYLSSDADNMRYDPSQNIIYVGYGNGAIGLINATNGKLVDSIRLDGHPESFQISVKSSPRIFVNVPDDNSIEVIDSQKLDVAAKWPNEGASDNYPMALDEDNHRLFVAYRQPPQLFVINTDSGKPIEKFDTVGGADDVYYDSKNEQVYVTGWGGYLQVISQQDANHYKEVAMMPTAQGGGTSLLVPQSNLLYIAVPDYSGQGAKIEAYEIHKVQ